MLNCSVHESFERTSANKDKEATKIYFLITLSKPLAVGSDHSEASWSRLVSTETRQHLLMKHQRCDPSALRLASTVATLLSPMVSANPSYY